MKTFKRIIAAAIAAAGVLSVAGCSGAAVSAKTATLANWNVRTSAAAENFFNDVWLNYKEVATYSIDLTEGANSTYSVGYAEGGVYVTEFYMESYDWSDASIPEGYAPEGGKVENVYVYTTSLRLSGEYTLASTGETKAFDDSVETICRYRLAGDNLQPVYSKQIVKNTAPNSLNAVNVDLTCVEVDAVYETFYDYQCAKATVYATDNASSGETTVGEISVADKKGYSLFDNSQLRAAVRAFALSGGSNYTFNVFTPQNNEVQTCNAAVASAVALDKEDASQKQICDALDSCAAASDYIFFDGSAATEEDEERNYRYNAVSLSISDSMKGASPVYWYASVENNDVNATKAVLLKMSTPLSFGLGTLNYTLKTLSFTAR